jgi:hypothetical protein
MAVSRLIYPIKKKNNPLRFNAYKISFEKVYNFKKKSTFAVTVPASIP